MAWKNKLQDNMFLRNMLADLFGRSAYSKTPGNFITYFQYKIGRFEQDHYLYFPKEPHLEQYYNEFFNKLKEYKGYDVVTYLEFHFSRYNNKHDFLRFMRYEVADRLKNKSSSVYRQKLLFALEWVTEKQVEWKTTQQAVIKQEIEEEVREIFTNPPADNPAEVENSVRELSKKLSGFIEKMMTDAEERLSAITEVLPSGRIELNNHTHQEKLIQLFILLQSVKAPAHIAKAEQLFKKISASDLAAILQLHFSAFKNLKPNTLQRKIGEATEHLDDKNPQVKRLTDALQDFFYEVRPNS